MFQRIFHLFKGKLSYSQMKPTTDHEEIVIETHLAENADPNLGDPDKYYEFHESAQIPFLNELYIQIFGKKNDGICVEVGAYDGKTCSNSFGLAKRGWRCFLIEPIEEFAAIATAEHEELGNVRVFNLAMHSFITDLILYVAGPLTTSSTELYSEYERLDWSKQNLPEAPLERSVKADTLNNFIATHLPGENIDVLIIDVEGSEFEVMQGFDLNLHKPKMVIIELPDFHPDLNYRKDVARSIFLYFISNGYLVVYKDAINTCFLSMEAWMALES